MYLLKKRKEWTFTIAVNLSSVYLSKSPLVLCYPAPRASLSTGPRPKGAIAVNSKECMWGKRAQATPPVTTFGIRRVTSNQQVTNLTLAFGSITFGTRLVRWVALQVLCLTSVGRPAVSACFTMYIFGNWYHKQSPKVGLGHIQHEQPPPARTGRNIFSESSCAVVSKVIPIITDSQRFRHKVTSTCLSDFQIIRDQQKSRTNRIQNFQIHQKWLR